MKTILLFVFLYVSIHAFSQTDLGNGVTDWGIIGDSSLSNRTAFTIDNSNNKWIGTNSNGVLKFDNNNWMYYNTLNSGLPSNNIKCLASNNNTIYIGTINGLAVYDGNWTVYTTSNSSLASNYIRALSYHNNTLWIAAGSGITSFDGSTWTTFTSADFSFISSSIKTISNAPDGSTCFGSGIGILYFNGSTWSADTTIKNVICIIPPEIRTVG